MKSAAKGKGHDHYLRVAKQHKAQVKADIWKARVEARKKERERGNDGTVGS
jgi:hypothetical protein